MEISLLVLGGLQALTLFIYSWVNKVYVSQPRYNHPMIFHNPTTCLLLIYGPYASSVTLVALAFFLTNSPWLFLGLTIAGFVAFSTRPHSDLIG